MLLWVTSVVALLLAWAAWAHSRRLGRKLEALNQSYWELRYDFTRLRSQVARLDPEQTERPEAPPDPAQVAYVPLSSMKKR